MNKKNQWLTSIIVLMALTGVEAQTANGVPRLVVNILVDRLQSDYMEAFMPLYGNDGFKRLMSEGRVYTQAEYEMADLDRASAAAVVVTGANAYDNGIVGVRLLDRNTLRPTYITDDKRYSGIGTADASSPQALMVSTVSDELKVASDGKALVYSISPYRETSVILGGHAADGALWIDDATGTWCTSSYYGSMPTWAQAAARQLSGTAATATEWQPYNAFVGNFSYFLSGGMKKPFKHKFEGVQRFRDYKTSGVVNEYVTKMAEACINNSMVGIDDITDYLSVAYYAGSYRDEAVKAYPMELQDTYVRLDASIAALLKTIDRRVGLANALVVMTSTGVGETRGSDDKQYRIPTGTFDIARAGNLLNVYLMAIYGSGKYVDTAFGQYLYLNHKLIEQKNIALGELLERAQDFLIQLSGVKDVYTSQRILQGAWTPGINRFRNSYNPKASGDILIQVTPGWTLVNETFGETSHACEAYTPFPIVFLGSKIVAQTIDTPVTVDLIAPTLSKSLRIRAPNASAKAPLTGVF